MSSGPPAKSVPMGSTWLLSHLLAYLTFLYQLEILSRPPRFIPFENTYCKMHTLFIVCSLPLIWGQRDSQVMLTPKTSRLVSSPW